MSRNKNEHVTSGHTPPHQGPAAMADAGTGEKRFREVLENIQLIGVMLDANGNITYCNQFLLSLTGWQDHEIIGKNWFKLFLPPDIRDTMESDVFLKIMQNGNLPVHYENDIITKDNRRLTIAWHNTVHLDSSGKPIAVTSIGEDISKRKETERELLKLQRSVENSPIGIVITDPDGNIEYTNPAFTITTGYTRSEATGQNPRILKSGVHDDAFYQDLWKTIKSGESWQAEMCNRKKDGSLFWENVSISPVKDANTAITNFVAIREDITDRKDLERLKEDVERIMRHDLKQPLNALKGLPYLLKLKGNLNRDQLKITDLIDQTGSKMLAMIDMSLDLFKMETDSYTYQPDNVDLVSVISELLEQNQTKLHLKRLKCTVSLNGKTLLDGTEIMILSEERLLYSLLSNLLLNAIEASPEKDDILIQITSDAHLSSISISNEGAVPPLIRNHFFAKFKTYGKTLGTGLGTYSAKLLASTMGYTLGMTTSDEQNSTTITITDIPTELIYIRKESDTEEQTQTKSSPIPLRILLAEDDVMNSKMMAYLLRNDGHHVINARNGTEALTKLEEEPVDLVLMDIRMPVMDGIKATHLIRNSTSPNINPNIPIIALTASMNEDDAGAFAEEGFTDYISKPANLPTLRKKIQTIVEEFQICSEDDPEIP